MGAAASRSQQDTRSHGLLCLDAELSIIVPMMAKAADVRIKIAFGEGDKGQTFLSNPALK